jgi:hypothetical protein
MANVKKKSLFLVTSFYYLYAFLPCTDQYFKIDEKGKKVLYDYVDTGKTVYQPER